MDSKHLLLLVACLGLLSGLRLTSTTTTTTFVAAMSLANQDLERYFRTVNASQTLAAMAEERIALDMYTYAYLNYSYLDAQNQPVERGFSEEKARYGEGRVLDVHGLLVHITDVSETDGVVAGSDFACSPNIVGTRGQPFPAAGVRWIALVRRGRCTFEEKVMHVHGKGAAGVIIYNDKPVSNLEKMQIKGKNRNITAVITYQDIGQDMARVVDQGITMMAAIIVGHSGMRPLNTMNRTSVLFVSISFIVLMIISLVWLVFYYIQRFRYLQSKDQQSRHLCSVTKKAIMKIPTKTGKTSDEKDADSDCCAICIEAYKTSDCIRVLPCKHEFHKNCIDPWLIEHRTCPMCKLDVLKFYGYVVGDQLTSSPNSPPNRITTHFNNALADVQVVPPVHMAIAAAATTTTVTTTVTNTTSTTTQTHSHMHTQTHTVLEPEPTSSTRNARSSSVESNNNCSQNSSSSSSNNSSSSSGNSSRNVSENCNSFQNSSGNSFAHALIQGARRHSSPRVVTASHQVTDV